MTSECCDCTPLSAGESLTHSHRIWLAVALILLAAQVAWPREMAAQRVAHTAIGVRSSWSEQAPAYANEFHRVEADSTKSRGLGKGRYILGGALVGAVIGGIVAASTEPRCESPGMSCAAGGTVEGVVVGAALGALGGWLTWAVMQSLRTAVTVRAHHRLTMVAVDSRAKEAAAGRRSDCSEGTLRPATASYENDCNRSGR